MKKILHIKRLKDATAILEQGRLEILGYEFGVEIIEDETAFSLDKLKKSQIYTMPF